MLDINKPLPSYAYTVDGYQVEIRGRCGDTIFGYRLYAIPIQNGYGEETGGYYDEPGTLEEFPAEKLFENKIDAKASIDAEFKKAQEQLAEVKSQIRDAKNELYEQTAQSKKLLEEAKRFTGLDFFVDVMDGKNCWVLEVRRDYQAKIPFIVNPIEKALVYEEDGNRYQKKLKLLTLHGKTQGDLQWQLHRYPDGSGHYSGYHDVFFFKTEEEARAKGIELMHRSQQGEQDKRPFLMTCIDYVEACKALGVEPIAEALEKAEEQRKNAAEAQLARAKQQLEAAQSAYDAVLTGQQVHLTPSAPAWKATT